MKVIKTAIGHCRIGVITPYTLDLELLFDDGEYFIKRSDLEDLVFMDEEFIHYFLCEGGDEEEEFSSEEEKMLKVFENYSLGDFGL